MSPYVWASSKNAYRCDVWPAQWRSFSTTLGSWLRKWLESAFHWVNGEKIVQAKKQSMTRKSMANLMRRRIDMAILTSGIENSPEKTPQTMDKSLQNGTEAIRCHIRIQRTKSRRQRLIVHFDRLKHSPPNIRLHLPIPNSTLPYLSIRPSTVSSQHGSNVLTSHCFTTRFSRPTSWATATSCSTSTSSLRHCHRPSPPPPPPPPLMPLPPPRYPQSVHSQLDY